MYLTKRNKLKILFKCKKLLNFFFKFDNYIFLHFNYYNKLNYINFLIYLQNNNFEYCNFSKINVKKINIINNIYFFNNINGIISFSKNQKITKDFLNIFTSYNNENIDFIYFKFKEFNTLISFLYLIEFFKFKNKKIINILIIIRSKNI